MEHTPSTGSQRHADLLLSAKGSSLREYLASKRADGLSFEQIARDLFADTDGEVSLSYATIKRWLIEFDLIEAVS